MKEALRGERRRRGRMESRESGWTPSNPKGEYWRPVEKSDERSQQGSPQDWEYRLLRRLERERKAGLGSSRAQTEERRWREKRTSPQSQRRSELRQSDDDTQPKLGGRAACRLWWSAIHLALAPVANQWGSHATSQCAPGQCKHSEQARSTLTQCPTACGAPV